MATQRFYDGQPGPDIRRELNNFEAILDGTVAAAQDASTAATSASVKAQQWANAAPGVEVETGKYSAKHWADRAQTTVTGGLIYRGSHSAASGAYPATPSLGDYYKISAAGTLGGVAYSVGDSIIYNGTNWDKIDSTDAVTSVAGRVGAVVLTKADVGLGNVDNTSDANKPVSTATQNALNLKANLASPTFTGLVIANSSPASIGIAALPNSNPGFESRAQGSGGTAGAATIAFHRPASHAVHFGIDTDNKFKVGGGSLGANAYAIYHENNKPTKADVGLGNVDNTSDANKPVSTATQNALNSKEASITAGTTSQYWRGDKTWRDFFTDVRAATLAGLSTATNAVVAATDTVLTAIGKLQAQVSTKFDKTGGDVNGNINFAGPGRRITGDFSNASFSNRVMFQSSTTNANTDIGILPNGLASSAGIWAFNNGSDLTNTAFLRSYINGGTDVRFESGRVGVYSFLPITFHTGGSERMRIDVSGSVGIGEAPSSQYKFQAANGNWCIHSDVGQLFIESAGRVNRWWIAANISDTVNDGVYIGRGGNGIGTGTKVLKILNDTTHINPNGGLGYGAGAGGTVTQATSKSTAVTLNKPSGQITMNNATLAAGGWASFAVNNTLVLPTDTVVATAVYTADYRVEVMYVTVGNFGVRVINLTGGTLADALIINFAIIRGATS